MNARRTDPRCPGCGIRSLHCVCDLLEPTPARTPIFVLRHTDEQYKSSNTGGLLRYVLPDAICFDHDPANPRPVPLPPGAVLLFPGGAAEGAAAGSAAPPPGTPLVLIDATWGQARRMVHRAPGLSALPRWSLPPAPPRPWRMRNATNPGTVSTLEAAAQAIALLEGEEMAAPLLRLYDRIAERQLKRRGRVGMDGLFIDGSLQGRSAGSRGEGEAEIAADQEGQGDFVERPISHI